MKIIITGATGAFGSAMVRYFAKKGHDIIAVGRMENPPSALLTLATYFKADITKPYKLPKADVCIHGAALSDDKANAKELYAPNILGTKHTVEAAKDCDRFIFISSSSVYLPEEGLINEEMAGNQNNKDLSAYGMSKLLSEKMLIKTFKGESCFILRPRAFYGPGDTQILPRMMKLVKKNVFERPGKLEIELSMTHYDNIAYAIECCMISELTGIRTYNVADEEVYTMITTLRKIFQTIYGKTLPEKEININIIKILAFFRVGGITPLLVRALTQNMVLDISKIKQELSYSSIIDLDDSLPAIGEWVRSIGGPTTLIKAEKSSNWKGL